MPAVNQVDSISGLGVFKNYSWPSTLTSFSKRNLFYGWNYCGKTTLSRVFRSFELGDLSKLPNGSKFSITIDGKKLTQLDVGTDLPAVFRVFNADFVESNLLWGGGAQPLLIIGADSIAIEEELQAVRLSSSRLDRWRGEIGRRYSASENDRDNALSTIAQHVKQTVKLSVFNRAPHLADVLRAHRVDIDAGILDQASLAKWQSIHTAEAKRPIQPILEPSLLVDQQGVYALFERTASRDAIQALVESPALENWVRQGVDLHSSSSDCAFCGSLISQDRLNALKGHFSIAVTNLIRDLDVADRVFGEQPVLELPSVSDFYEDLQIKFNEVNLSLTRLIARRHFRVKEIRAELESKKARVEESYTLLSRPINKLGAAIVRRIRTLNEFIAEHNERVFAGQRAKQEAESKLISHYSCSGYKTHELARLIRDVAFLEGWRSRSDKYAERISKRIRRLNSDLASASIGADRVNTYIRLYFGSDRLRVMSVEGRYKVHREDSIASTLSEGEKTAISFAYFMARLEEDGLDNSKLVVYIDDPISSLDANHVFNTFSIIRSKLSGVAQLFVSTHNYEFFRIMKGDTFFREFAKKDERRTSYYQLVRFGDESSIVDLPPPLRRFASEYHLLVSMLFQFCLDGSVDSHMMPNVIRRILEAYTSFRFPSSSEKLDVRLARVFDDDAVSMRVYKLVNHLSHCDTVTAVLELPNDQEVREVAQIVLSRLREFDASHFDGMKAVFEAA
ncbi:AAA family ATPase [Thermomonas sp.]|uniref:AAA family ATPase n=1 Tax=Thermomonas sp. TaxID=1971895 RepID=UPI003784041B